jgi:hypothetical protein
MHAHAQASTHALLHGSVSFPRISWSTGEKVDASYVVFYMLRVKMVYNFESDDDCNNAIMSLEQQ